jgi:hypothetical protein
MRVQPSNPEDPAFVHSPWQSFSDWTPVISGCSVSNNKARQACIDLSVEWQAFAGCRVKQDLHLFQELCAAKSPKDILYACSLFWRQAAVDYGEEYSAKLTAGLVPDRITPVANGDALPRPPQSKAA